MLLDCPRFRVGVRVEVVAEGVFILSERNDSLLNGTLYQLLAPLIDGYRTTDDIVDLLADRATAAEVYYALMRLAQKGYIVESKQHLPAALEPFCHALNISPEIAYQRLQTTSIAVKGLGSVPVSEFISTLQSLHIQVRNESETHVVLTDDYLHEDLAAFNQKALQTQSNWILVKPVGTVVWIGPLFQPKKTGCWSCLAARLQENRPVERFIQRHQNTSAPLTLCSNSLPSTVQAALGIASTELLKQIVQTENRHLEGTLVTYDTLSLEVQRHKLVRRPQCHSCGIINTQADRKPLPVILGSRKKAFTTDGGHRCIPPQETLSQFQHHISPITGVVRQLKKLPTGRTQLNHTYIAGHHFSTIFDDLRTLRQSISGRSAGKGRTDEQAKASAFCEAIERYSGVFQGDEIRHRASYQKLGNEAIHPNDCMNFSQLQYLNRTEWNANCQSWFQKVPEPFDEEREVEWTPVWSLTQQVFKYLPTAYCYYGYPESSKSTCWADSNGCAAGNTMEEAILQGFMELVERDAVALWWYNQLQKPKIDLTSFNDPYTQELITYHQSLQRDLWVLDITSDLNIPTFAAISRRVGHKVENIVLGYGAHFDPKIALSRALTEVNQILPAVLSAYDDGSTNYSASNDPLATYWWKTATLANQPYLAPDQRAVPKLHADYPQVWTDDLRDDVLLCQKIVEKHGMEMLVLDQTRADIGLRVVKVVIPGMRHMWRRLGPGRLYEVPVKMHWLNEICPEDQLNPCPMWM